MMIWNKRNDKIKALILPRNWGVQAPQLYSICMIMVCDFETNVFWLFCSFGANCQEEMMGIVVKSGMISAGDRTHDQQKNGKNGWFAIRLPSSPARGPVPDCGA